jgi:hypothetical protein
MLAGEKPCKFLEAARINFASSKAYTGLSGENVMLHDGLASRYVHHSLLSSLLLLAVVCAHSAGGEKQKENEKQAVDVADELKKLLGRLRSEELRSLAKSKAKDLDQRKDAVAQEGAVDFFYDLRAAPILLRCLAGDFDTERIVDRYLDVFGREHLVQLYALLPPRLPATEDDVQEAENLSLIFGREEIIRKTTTYAAKLLGVKPPVYIELKRPDLSAKHLTTQVRLRGWWVTMINEAKAKEAKEAKDPKRPKSSFLDNLLKAVEKAPKK